MYIATVVSTAKIKSLVKGKSLAKIALLSRFNLNMFQCFTEKTE